MNSPPRCARYYNKMQHSAFTLNTTSRQDGQEQREKGDELSELLRYSTHTNWLLVLILYHISYVILTNYGTSIRGGINQTSKLHANTVI